MSYAPSGSKMINQLTNHIVVNYLNLNLLRRKNKFYININGYNIQIINNINDDNGKNADSVHIGYQINKYNYYILKIL
jgi:hypothetical protein